MQKFCFLALFNAPGDSRHLKREIAKYSQKALTEIFGQSTIYSQKFYKYGLIHFLYLFKFIISLPEESQNIIS